MTAKTMGDSRVPAWVEKKFRQHDKMLERLERASREHDRLLIEIRKDVRYSKDLVDDHERWLREHNIRLSRIEAR